MASAADDTWHADNVPLKLACLGWRQGDLPLLVGRGAGAGAGAGAVVLHAALSFLLVKCGGKALPPELAGDVARSAARLVGEVKALGLGDEAAAAAEQGAPASARLLDALCDRALAASGHQFPSPAYPTTEAAAFGVGDDGRLVVEDEADDAAAAAAPPAMAASPAGHGLLRPSIDAAAWEAEVNQSSGWLEQAAARTADITLHAQWRTRLEQSAAAVSIIGGPLPAVEAALDVLSASLTAASASVREQEQRLGSSPQLQPLLAARSTAAAAQEAARKATAARVSDVAALAAAAAAEEAALAEARAALDARSGSLADAAPLIALKRALTTLRDDSRELNVRLGVASHALMQARLAAAERGKVRLHQRVCVAASAAVASSGEDSAGSDGETDS